MNGSRLTRRMLTACLLAVLPFLFSQAALASTYEAFSGAHEIVVSGYTGSAMEPAISPDGEHLLFNSSNVAPNMPELEIATLAGPGSFEYDGPLQGEGVNEPGQLSGTPSLDREGNIYFVSPRSYAQTLATVYAGRLAGGSVTGVHLVDGIAGEPPGLVDFDAAVSPDGASMYVSVGAYHSGSLSSAQLALYDRTASGFAADPAGARLLHAVDKTGALDYAAAVSADGLELFFTRAFPAKGAKGQPSVYRAARKRLGKPFGHVQRVGAVSGFAEAPSLSDDGRTLYYHALAGATFHIMAVTRPAG